MRTIEVLRSPEKADELVAHLVSVHSREPNLCQDAA